MKTQRNKIEEYLETTCSLINRQKEKDSSRENDAPCEKCGGKDYIQLFRNVVSEIEGRVTGHYSLFFGSVSGHISGHTQTLPLLSCSKCHNEKEISTWEYTFDRDEFWHDMHDFFFSVDEGEKRNIKSIYLNNPVATREYMINNRNYEFDFYNEMVYWDTSTWAECGFEINKVKRKLLFFTWYSYPSWEELERAQSQ